MIRSGTGIIDVTMLIQERVDSRKSSVKNETRVCVNTITKGQFQADVLMAKHFLDGLASVIVSGDSPLMMYAGKDPTKDFAYDGKLKTTSSFTVQFYFLAMSWRISSSIKSKTNLIQISQSN